MKNILSIVHMNMTSKDKLMRTLFLKGRWIVGRDDHDNSKKKLTQTLKHLIIPSGKVNEEFSREFAVIGNTKALKELNKSIRKRNKKK